MTLVEKRTQIGQWLLEGDGQALWDLLCGLRGPDTPSEREDMDYTQRTRAYTGRRERKYKTAEVIREKAFFGQVGGGARHHDADHIILPPASEWDHFDTHMQRAADVLGLKVVMAQAPAGRVQIKLEGEEPKKTKQKQEATHWVFPCGTLTPKPEQQVVSCTPFPFDDEDNDDE